MCRRNLSDRPQLANQHTQTTHITLSASYTRQFRLILFRWTHRKCQVDCTWLRESKNVPLTLWNTWVPPHFFRTLLHQWREHSLPWRHVNSMQPSDRSYDSLRHIVFRVPMVAPCLNTTFSPEPVTRHSRQGQQAPMFCVWQSSETATPFVRIFNTV